MTAALGAQRRGSCSHAALATWEQQPRRWAVTRRRRRRRRGHGLVLGRSGHGPIRVVGWRRDCLSRSDIGLVSARPGASQDHRSRWSRAAARLSRRLVWYVIVVTSDDLLAELAACGAELFWPAPGPPDRAARPRTRGRATVMKNFSGAGFEALTGREHHPTCVVPDRVAGPGRRAGRRDGPGAPGRFDGVLIAV